jgi:ankyrin repeat domain-containing protein 50
VIEHITTERVLHADVGICFVYFNYQSQEMWELPQIVLALMKQLFRNRATVPPEFLRIKQDSLDPSAIGNADSFVILARGFKETFIVIDALDECPKDKRHQVLEYITVIAEELTCAKIFVTSRRETDILAAFHESRTPTIEIEAKSISADISNYASSEIRRLRHGRHGKKLYLKEDALEDKIVENLTTKAEGM